jgi:hypothetical protein
VELRGVEPLTSGIAAGSAADFTFGDLATDVILRSVGVQRNLGAVENGQKLSLVGVKPSEQAIEHDEAGAPFEDAVESSVDESSIFASSH